MKFFAHVNCGRGVVLWQQCSTLCTSGVVDDVMFSHNGDNGHNQRWHYASSGSPGGGTRGEVCCLWLHCCCYCCNDKGFLAFQIINTDLGFVLRWDRRIFRLVFPYPAGYLNTVCSRQLVSVYHLSREFTLWWICYCCDACRMLFVTLYRSGMWAVYLAEHSVHFLPHMPLLSFNCHFYTCSGEN